MQKVFASVVLLLMVFMCTAQSYPKNNNDIKRPKLVVGIVVDQMRWDYLYRLNSRLAATGGFKRMLDQGYSCENTLISYSPSITACGHAGIFTGSVPAIHGIVGNNWFDNFLRRDVYCTEDKSVKTLGSNNAEAGEMSPANLYTTTITDELKLATNFRSKVIGIAIKDRGAILPAGHGADAAYWYDNTSGKWISSTYYMKELPKWVTNYNASGAVDKYYAKGWNTLYPANTYLQSTGDENSYENTPFGIDAKGFPYDFKSMIGKDYLAINTTPHGNTMTLDMARAAVDAEKLGNNESGVPDFLTVSFSSPDYIGHSFGPNSMEAEDNFLRLDKDLGAFFDHLDQKLGKGEYLVFLSADHGVAHVPGFMKEKKLPGGTISSQSLMTALNNRLNDKYGSKNIISYVGYFQIYLNNPLIDSAKFNKEEIIDQIIKYTEKLAGVARVYKLKELFGVTMNSKMKDMMANGYFPLRSGDIQVLLHSGWIDGGAKGTTHGSWNPYDTHIPLLWYGCNIKPGKTNREVAMADIAPTVAALLHIQMPSGNIGHVIEELTK